VKLAIFWLVMALLISFASGPLQSYFNWTENERYMLWAAYSVCLLLMALRNRSVRAAKSAEGGE
jgi:hypothetical protein